jgi:hypothetical protein
MELAAHYGIRDYPAPAGGCLLTDPVFSRRLRDLFQQCDSPAIREVELLKVGRHLRLSDAHKVVVGRNQEENRRLRDLYVPGDLLLDARDYSSPLVLIPGGATEPLVQQAAAILLRYSDAPQDQTAVVMVSNIEATRELLAEACGPEHTESLMI